MYKRAMIYFTTSHGQSWISRVIKWVLGSKFSHVAIGFLEGKDQIIYEADLNKGTVRRSYKEFLADNSIIYKFSLDINSLNFRKMRTSADRMVGRKYDLKSAIGSGWDRLFGRKDDGRQELERLFCSELVTFLLEDIYGEDFTPEDPENVDPRDLYEIICKDSRFVKRHK